MAKFRIRYDVGRGPTNSDDVVEVEAGMHRTESDFITFYEDAVENVIGGLNPKGNVVLSVATKYVIDVEKID